MATRSTGAVISDTRLAGPNAGADRHEEPDAAGDLAIHRTWSGQFSPTHRNLAVRRSAVRHTDYLVSVRATTVALMRSRRGLALNGAVADVRPSWVRASVITLDSRANRRRYYDHLRAPAGVDVGGQVNSEYSRWLTPPLDPGFA